MEIYIEQLSDKIKKNGFDYILIKRDSKKAIYAQQNKLGKIKTYEVFTIKLKNTYEKQKKLCALNNQKFDLVNNNEWHEGFPSNEDFGKTAWTYTTLELANKKYNQL